MGRVNKFTDGVFTNVVGSQEQIPDYERFLNVQKNLNEPSGELKSILKKYEKLITKHKVTFDLLANLEEVIMQIRTRDNLSYDEVKLNVLREYIYARVPFYRTDKDSKDIRVIAGVTKVYGTEMSNLSGNEEFKDITITKLKLAMDKIINENLNNLKKVK